MWFHLIQNPRKSYLCPTFSGFTQAFMEYNFPEIENKWRKHWADHKPFKAEENSTKPKYYVLDMFPYPSGAGLHVGHPLGYIASDIYARYKRLKGFNVLHPMGYDSFGLPAEQYAIQTGLHPAVTTEINIDGCLDANGDLHQKYLNADGTIKHEALIDKNKLTRIDDDNYRDNIIKGYRKQLDIIGFSYDWDREVRTSDPNYYRWTQWIFIQLFNSWYNPRTNKAEHISTLEHIFATEGFSGSEHDILTGDIEKDLTAFTPAEWNAFDETQQRDILMYFRLAYLGEAYVNWCPALGTVLANDEVINGVSERGGHPVERKLLKQWSMRITAYAQRLLDGLEGLDWTDSIKEAQRNWIGRSEGASLRFSVQNHDAEIEVFTTRPDTVFGVAFVTLAPEHELVTKVTTDEQREAVNTYVEKAKNRSERERMADVNTISGVFTGSYVTHPFTNEPVPIWVGDYVLVGYGTGAVMAVPAHDERDYKFAKHFNLPIKQVIEPTREHDFEKDAWAEKEGTLINSDFLNGLDVKKAIKLAVHKIDEQGFGKKRINYRLRDAVFGRQRYWGEPIPIYYKNGVPYALSEDELPLTLPEVDKYLPTEDGEPPLARANNWKYKGEYDYEHSTMPGWAGSSWYFLRYMDPNNEGNFADPAKIAYWKQVDLYIGGSEHATGHLLYSRFWTKVLFDLGLIGFDEPFQKMINQGMILGKSAIGYIGSDDKLYSFDCIDQYEHLTFREVRILIDLINDDESIQIDNLRSWQPQYEKIEIVPNATGKVIVKREVDKMSKRWFNVVNPDDLCVKFGADTLRMYEMFLGPLEQFKPWDTKGINGVHNFLRKLWRLFYANNEWIVTDEAPSKDSLKTLHKTIKKIEEDLERFSFNTGVSQFMICVNELTDQKCRSREVLEQLVILLSPYAPHVSEELWAALGHEAGTISTATFPQFDPEMLVEANFAYPVSFNGKMRFTAELPTTMGAAEVQAAVMAMADTTKWLEGKEPKKVIVVPGRIVNFVV